MRESRRTMARRSSDSPAPSPKTRSPRIGPDFSREAVWHAQGISRVAGVDEAGRGPLAGPVVAAAVILSADRIPPGLDDSKKLGTKQREALFDAILQDAEVGIGTASACEIDELNIRQATFLAMRRALVALPDAPQQVLVDGRDVPAACPFPAFALVSGDALCLSIAAASIVAKVTRDRIMAALCFSDPRYEFRRHMGYPTAAHLAALRLHGAGPYHRVSFGPVRALLSLPSSQK